MKITESTIEEYAIEELEKLGFQYLYGPDIAFDGQNPERQSYEEVVLIGRLRSAIANINPSIPHESQEHALREVLRISSPDLLTNNEAFHRYLVDGVPVQYRVDGEDKSDLVWLIDFTTPSNNEFLVVNQYTIIENNQNKRPDIILFINGLPIVVFELKNAVDENATLEKAFDQLQTYKAVIPSLFTFNAICIVSDGLECRAGSVSAGLKRFMAWKTSDGKKQDSKFTPQMETLIKGMLNPQTLLDLVRHFIVFQKIKKEDAKTGLTQIETVKILASYHQYYAVNKAVATTQQAATTTGDRKGGVVWHTQGSGKSLSMVFYVGKLVLSLDNPTVVVITDRNDLDDQLFDTFASSKQLLRQGPIQAESREDLKKLLKVASGGIVFSTIQKFSPDEGRSEYDQLSDRSNIVVVADEAHRTQYGFEAKLVDVKDKQSKEVIGKRIAYGFAKYMHEALPKATYIGFTGTPIESEDVNTSAVFGQYVDIYDIAQSVEDKATVKIYYESRLAKVNLDEEGKRIIEEHDKEVEESQELSENEKAKAKWTRLEAIIGHPERIKNLANDIVTHFEQRLTAMDGKGMIVAMSRRIASNLYYEIIKLRPDWHNKDLSKGVIKVVMTASSSDGPEMSALHTSKDQRRSLSDRMKDPNDPLKLVIVRDMWLTGFDAPCLHTMYIDKPMQGHNLMQAIARVNRVFGEKPGGLIVDYLGIASDLKKALSFYSNAGGKGSPTELQSDAVEILLEKLEVVKDMFAEASKSMEDIQKEDSNAYAVGTNSFNYERFYDADPRAKLSIILQAEEHILGLENGKDRFVKEVMLLSQAYALAIPHETALLHNVEIAFFQAVKARLVKFTGEGVGGTGESFDSIIKQIVDQALTSDKVIDIFDAAGIKKPDVSVLSDEFLMEIKGLKHKNLGLELLKKILNNEIKSRSKINLVRSKKLLEMLENAIKRYQNNLISTTEVIEELIEIAKGVRASDEIAKNLGLSVSELAFYDALAVNESAVQVLGDEMLRTIAREIAEKVRANTTIDWSIRESARAKLKVLVRRTLNKYGYPPDKQEEAIETVLAQTKLMADNLMEI